MYLLIDKYICLNKSHVPLSHFSYCFKSPQIPIPFATSAVAVLQYGHNYHLISTKEIYNVTSPLRPCIAFSFRKFYCTLTFICPS